MAEVTHLGLGVAARWLGQADTARREYERAQALSPERPEAYYNLALLYPGPLWRSMSDFTRTNALLLAFECRVGPVPRFAVASSRAHEYMRENSTVGGGYPAILDTLNSSGSCGKLRQIPPIP